MNADKQREKDAKEAVARVQANPDKYPASIRGFAEMCDGMDKGLSREEIRERIGVAVDNPDGKNE